MDYDDDVAFSDAMDVAITKNVSNLHKYLSQTSSFTQKKGNFLIKHFFRFGETKYAAEIIQHRKYIITEKTLRRWFKKGGTNTVIMCLRWGNLEQSNKMNELLEEIYSDTRYNPVELLRSLRLEAVLEAFPISILSTVGIDEWKEAMTIENVLSLSWKALWNAQSLHLHLLFPNAFKDHPLYKHMILCTFRCKRAKAYSI